LKKKWSPTGRISDPQRITQEKNKKKGKKSKMNFEGGTLRQKKRKNKNKNVQKTA